MKTKLLHIANDRYYQSFKDNAVSEIKSQQFVNDNLFVKEIKELAEEI